MGSAGPWAFFLGQARRHRPARSLAPSSLFTSCIAFDRAGTCTKSTCNFLCKCWAAGERLKFKPAAFQYAVRYNRRYGVFNRRRFEFRPLRRCNGRYLSCLDVQKCASRGGAQRGGHISERRPGARGPGRGPTVVWAQPGCLGAFSSRATLRSQAEIKARHFC